MKKILNMFLFTLLFLSSARSQNFGIHIKNNSGMDLIYSVTVEHGMSAMPGQINKGDKYDWYFNPNPLTGVEGHIIIFPVGNQYESIQIYYVNPLVGQGTYSINSSNGLLCKALKWNLIDNGMTCELDVEVTDPNSQYGKPVPVALNTNGTIKGSILWNVNDIQSPEVYPYGNAFTCKVWAPTQFVESSGPFMLEKTGTYNGKKGYFQGSNEVGNITYETVPSSNPNYVEIKYTITGVPADIPLEMDITADYSKSKWTAGPHKQKPGDDYVFIVGTFPSTSKTTVTVDNNLSQLSGVDFNCDGDWLKLDANGNITGGGTLINKIANRKNAPVLPGGMITAVTFTKASGTAVMQPAAAQTNQVQTRQVQGAVQKVRIRN